MPKRKQDYKQVLDDVVESLKHTPEELEKALDTSAEVIDAAKEMTKDEVSLISAYVKSDLKEFADNYQQSKQNIPDSPFFKLIEQSMWQALLDITDRTQIEWLEVFEDLEHKGLYQVGDVIGLGALVCEKCGHRAEYNHAVVIEPCLQCGNQAFTRVALRP